MAKDFDDMMDSLDSSISNDNRRISFKVPSGIASSDDESPPASPRHPGMIRARSLISAKQELDQQMEIDNLLLVDFRYNEHNRFTDNFQYLDCNGNSSKKADKGKAKYPTSVDDIYQTLASEREIRPEVAIRLKLFFYAFLIAGYCALSSSFGFWISIVFFVGSFAPLACWYYMVKTSRDIQFLFPYIAKEHLKKL